MRSLSTQGFQRRVQPSRVPNRHWCPVRLRIHGRARRSTREPRIEFTLECRVFIMRGAGSNNPRQPRRPSENAFYKILRRDSRGSRRAGAFHQIWRIRATDQPFPTQGKQERGHHAQQAHDFAEAFFRIHGRLKILLDATNVTFSQILQLVRRSPAANVFAASPDECRHSVGILTGGA